jgi:DNA uptake protein ComE-like DNA-binding protein
MKWRKSREKVKKGKREKAWSGTRFGVLSVVVLCAAVMYPQASHTPERVKAAAGDRLDVNRASVGELEKLPGVTQVWAERIVRFRPYHSRLDLVNKGVIPPRIYHRIEGLVVAHRE